MSKQSSSHHSKQKQEKESAISNKTLLHLAIVLFVAAVGFFVIYSMFAPQPTEGTKTITVEVIDNAKESKLYELNTDAPYLIDAMKELQHFTFSGYEGPYGLTLITINGVSADWEKDNAFWSIYVNGEQGNYGVDAQPVNDGDAFQLIYTGIDADA